MTHRLSSAVLALSGLAALAGPASAQTWTSDQKEVWAFEEQQWQMSKDHDSTWIEKMVHPNVKYWDNGQAMPQDKASLTRWNRYTSADQDVLEQELFPVSMTITGNLAVAQYYYQTARENYKKERETVHGHYTDILLKENGKWSFIAWAGGEDPKK
jgi:Domain of unknown function (DUF4440)